MQSLTSSAQQVASVYAAEAPEAALSIDEARNLIETKLGASMRGYDPDIVRVQSMLYDLAYARAQMANPSGEVSRQGFERALESLGQGVLSSQTDLENRAGRIRARHDWRGPGQGEHLARPASGRGAIRSILTSSSNSRSGRGDASSLRCQRGSDPVTEAELFDGPFSNFPTGLRPTLSSGSSSSRHWRGEAVRRQLLHRRSRQRLRPRPTRRCRHGRPAFPSAVSARNPRSRPAIASSARL